MPISISVEVDPAAFVLNAKILTVFLQAITIKFSSIVMQKLTFLFRIKLFTTTLNSKDKCKKHMKVTKIRSAYYFCSGCFSLLLGLTVSANVRAQAIDVYSLSIVDLLKVKIETSTLTEKTLKDVPAPVTVFTRRDIESLGVKFLHDLLEFTPGYQVSRYSNYPYEYSASARGLSDGSSSKKILFLLDGHPINSPRSGNISHLANFPLEHVERIEVIRGPGSSIYGSNAFTGVVNIISRKSSQSISISTGSLLSYDFFASINEKINDYEFGLQLNAVNAYGDTYLVTDTFGNSMTETKDPYSQVSSQLTLSNKDFEFLWLSKTLKMSDFYHVGRVSNIYNESEQSANLVFAQYKHIWSPYLESTFLADYVISKITNSNQSSRAGAFSKLSTPNSDEPLHGTGIFKDQRVSFKWQNNYLLSETSNIQFGFEWQQNEELQADGLTNYSLQDLLSNTFPVRYFPNTNSLIKIGGEGKQRFTGFYTQLQSKGNSIDWIIGGRIDSYQNFGEQFSPRLGIIYYPTDSLQFKLLYGEAFRAPELSERELFAGVTRSGNPNLESESIATTDVILQYTDDAFLMTVGVFYNSYRDPIINGNVNGLVGFVNGDGDSTQGLETEFHWQAAMDTNLKFSMTHFFSLPSSAFRESKTTASMQLIRQFNKFQLSIAGIYRSNRQTPLTDTSFKNLGSYAYWRAQAKYAMSDDWTFSLFVDNAFDRQFYSPSVSSELPDGVPNRGVSYSLSSTWTF